MSLFKDLLFMSVNEFKSSASGGGNKRSGALRFMNEPKTFDGSSEVNVAVLRFTRFNRLRVTAKLTDEEALFLVGDYVTGKAETWWNVVGSKAVTWDEFDQLFKKQYLADQEDKWWQELQSLKQGKAYPTIDDVSLKMQKLLDLVDDNKSHGYQVRTFLNAINPNIAYEVKKHGTPATFEAAVEKANQVERSFMKYGMAGGDFRSRNQIVSPSGISVASSVGDGYPSNASEASAVSSMFSLVDKLEKLSINLVKLSTSVQGGNMSQGYENQGNNGYVPAANQGVRRQYVCFTCNQPGHNKMDCPNNNCYSNSSVATGSNAIPLGNSGGGGNAVSGVLNSQHTMAEILTAAANLVHIAAKIFEMDQSDSFITAVNLIANAANW